MINHTKVLKSAQAGSISPTSVLLYKIELDRIKIQCIITITTNPSLILHYSHLKARGDYACLMPFLWWGVKLYR